MVTKFDIVTEALDRFCRHHKCVLRATDEGIAVEELKDGDDPDIELVDLTDRPKRFEVLPFHFDTFIKARGHPGYVGECFREIDAKALAAQHPGSEVVAIGAKKPRGWAVVRPREL